MLDKIGSGLLVAYSLFATVALTTLLSRNAQDGNGHFKEITAERINIREPDGTLRTVISSKARFPGTYIKNVEHPRDDRETAGMIFLNDQGSEVGGMVYGGHKDAKGNVESHGHLSFDQYGATQVFSIDAFEENEVRSSRLKIFDWRDKPGQATAARLVLGKTTDRAVGLSIMDSKGRDRIVVRVRPDDTPEIVFRDAKGKVTKTITP